MRAVLYEYDTVHNRLQVVVSVLRPRYLEILHQGRPSLFIHKTKSLGHTNL